MDSRGAAARGTAIVMVDGKHAGSAVLVDGRHLLTAAHVMRGPVVSGRRARVDRASVIFPALPPTPGRPEPVPVPVARVELPPEAESLDISVLELVDAPPEWWPEPVAVSAGQRLPTKVALFGYPKGDHTMSGVWREFMVAGPIGVARVQLDWASGAGSWKGHSGGPILDAGSGALVGVLVEGSEDGLFDRYVTTTGVAGVWPELPRGWLFGGEDGRGHFDRRARGIGRDLGGGGSLRGRAVALDAVRGWLSGDEEPGLPLVVTGQPGAGKSAVVCRSVVAMAPERRWRGLAFHAQSATHVDLLRAVGDLLGADVSLTANSLLDVASKSGASSQPRFLVVVDSLDEAATKADLDAIAETLRELAGLPAFRVVVATRPLASRARFGPESVLSRLGVREAKDPALVDLDADQYFDPQDLREFAAGMLAQRDVERPGPSGRAWEAYRGDEELRLRMARVVAGKAQRNFLVVALAAETLSRGLEPVDPAAPNFDETSVPAAVGEALGRYLNQLQDQHTYRPRELLDALSYGRGSGLSDRLWIGFARALGYDATVSDLDQLRRSRAADFLLETVPETRGTVTALFHSALKSELQRGRPDPHGDERAILDVLWAEAADAGWEHVEDYWRHHAPDHAAAAGQPEYLERLLDEAGYLAIADLPRLISRLTGSDEWLSPMSLVVRRVGQRADALVPDRRLRLLALTAAHLGLPAEQSKLVAGGLQHGAEPLWAHRLGAFHQDLAGHVGLVTAVAVGRADGRDLVVSGGEDETVLVWDAVTGRRAGRPLTEVDRAVYSLAVGRVGDREVVVVGDGDGKVCVGEQSTWDWIWIARAHHGPVFSVAMGRAGDRDVVVSCGDDSARVWDAATGEELGNSLRQHEGAVNSVTLGRAGGRDVVVSGGEDGTVRLWDVVTGEEAAEPLRGHDGGVWSVAAGHAGGRDVVVSGGQDGTVRLWDSATGEQVGESLGGNLGGVFSVALGPAGHPNLLACGGMDGMVKVWDAASRQRLGEPLTGHNGRVQSVAIGRAGGRDVVVSGGEDGMVRVWEPTSGGQLMGKPLIGHDAIVTSTVASPPGGQDIVASVGGGLVRIWDGASGHPVGEPLIGYQGWINSVAVGRDVIATGGRAGVQVWDRNTGRLRNKPSTEPAAGPDGAVTALALSEVRRRGRGWRIPRARRTVVVSGHVDGTLRLWSTADGRPIAEPLRAHGQSTTAISVGQAGDREVIVTGGRDGLVWVLDAASWEPVDELIRGEHRQVEALALGRVGGRDVVVHAGEDGTVRVRAVATWEPLCVLIGHHGWVSSVDIGSLGGRDVVVSGGMDSTVRVWDATEGTELSVLDLAAPVKSVALASPARLYVASGAAVAAFSWHSDAAGR